MSIAEADQPTTFRRRTPNARFSSEDFTNVRGDDGNDERRGGQNLEGDGPTKSRDYAGIPSIIDSEILYITTAVSAAAHIFLGLLCFILGSVVYDLAPGLNWPIYHENTYEFIVVFTLPLLVFGGVSLLGSGLSYASVLFSWDQYTGMLKTGNIIRWCEISVSGGFFISVLALSSGVQDFNDHFLIIGSTALASAAGGLIERDMKAAGWYFPLVGIYGMLMVFTGYLTYQFSHDPLSLVPAISWVATVVIGLVIGWLIVLTNLRKYMNVFKYEFLWQLTLMTIRLMGAITLITVAAGDHTHIDKFYECL